MFSVTVRDYAGQVVEVEVRVTVTDPTVVPPAGEVPPTTTAPPTTTVLAATGAGVPAGLATAGATLLAGAGALLLRHRLQRRA
ncbi:hypothetical protein [Cellulomonas denverensis]|uniref:hypothetical protein n=1 Tax=Cellulomonas denverensis TaxID=264297 RepID=UPI00357118B7